MRSGYSTPPWNARDHDEQNELLLTIQKTASKDDVVYKVGFDGSLTQCSF